ncbi:MAG TPA: class II fructose-bisphosphate aldolase [Terriglobia bacterium]|nr:class II fructose-bisphosphate aldolase [Terriglobia bacterium]
MNVRTALELITRDRAVYEILDGGGIVLKNPQKFIAQTLDVLVWNAVLGESEEVRTTARWIIRRAGLELGVIPSSIQGLYEARGRKEAGGFTVPAINIRGLSYDVARAVVRAALSSKAGAFIFELSRRESIYTEQRPAEYATVMIAAALKEGFEGPLFIQGDHYQVNANRFAKDPEAELQAVRDFVQESIAAGYYNIDLDASTLADLGKPGVREQQRANFEASARLAAYVRAIEPTGISVALGGEIGEIGKQNSTVDELAAYMEGFSAAFSKNAGKKKGLAKISVQTGTTHGGVVLPTGVVAQVAIDFATLRQLSATARDRYGLAGAVQHGASTLPSDAFHKFVECETAEVHLATEFQNLIYENAAFPRDLKEEIYRFLKKACAHEKAPDDSDEQFIYKTRSRAFGPFKRKIWELPADVRSRIGADLERKFSFLFEQLKVQRTAELVRKTVPPVAVYPTAPPALMEAVQRVQAVT